MAVAMVVFAARAASPVLAQAQATQAPAAQAAAPTSFAAVVASARPDVPATLTVANRDIVVLRAAILGRSSADRVASAELLIHHIIQTGGSVRASLESIDGALAVNVNGRNVFAIVPADVDALAGETLDAKGQETLARLQVALDEEVEAETPRVLLDGGLLAAVATIVFLVVVWLVRRLDDVFSRWLAAAAERRLQASPELAAAARFVRQTRLIQYAQRVVDVISVVAVLVAAYWWLFFVLRQFPYSRPWGDALRGFFVDRFEWLGLSILHALPGLFTVVLIVVATRLVVVLLGRLFAAIEQGSISVPGLYPETVAPTRKLVTGFLWLFALVVAYPYIPGSNTEAFKGASVFVGLVVSLGSTGIVNQLMSGLTLTYSRAVRVGDYVRVGEIEGTVKHLGTLSAKIETPLSEDVTIPNAVLISREVTNYSRNTSATEVFVPASVTISYDTPWRQVQSLLLLATARTPGLRHEPAPIVVQHELADFFVKYTLLVVFEDPRQRFFVLGALHANIQDAFNEYGVQIMSPHYWSDPQTPKIVPRDRWSPPPASEPRK